MASSNSSTASSSGSSRHSDKPHFAAPPTVLPLSSSASVSGHSFPHPALLPLPLPTSSSSAPSPSLHPHPPPAPFIISIGGPGFDRPLFIQQQREKSTEAETPEGPNGGQGKAGREKRHRAKIGWWGLILVMLATIVAMSLALSSWALLRTIEHDHHEKGQETRIDTLERALRALRVRTEQLETELEQYSHSMEELQRQNRENYEVSALVATPPPSSVVSSKNSNLASNDQPNTPSSLAAVPGGMTKEEATQSKVPEGDFVIYVNGRPMSGKEFMARGAKGGGGKN